MSQTDLNFCLREAKGNRSSSQIPRKLPFCFPLEYSRGKQTVPVFFSCCNGQVFQLYPHKSHMSYLRILAVCSL